MTVPTVTLQAPASFGGVVTGTDSGATYVLNGSGQVTVPFQDVEGLSSLGFVPVVYSGRVGLLGSLLGANFNSTADQPILLTVPSTSLYRVSKITVTNASISLTTAAGGVYDAAAKGGDAIVAAGQVYTALSTSKKALDLTIAANLRLPAGTGLWLSLTTAQGAAATADVYVFGDLLTQ